MGSGNKGLYSGTYGNEADSVSVDRDSLISELEENGIKFTKEDIVFITKDRTGQTVWLENGNSSAGLEHILYGNGKSPGHAADFEKAFGVSKTGLPQYLQKVITQGNVISNKLIKRGSREGFERVYYYEGRYHVVTGIGTNGFIISAYPKRIKEE